MLLSFGTEEGGYTNSGFGLSFLGSIIRFYTFYLQGLPLMLKITNKRDGYTSHGESRQRHGSGSVIQISQHGVKE